jgi:hypothetical protein
MKPNLRIIGVTLLLSVDLGGFEQRAHAQFAVPLWTNYSDVMPTTYNLGAPVPHSLVTDSKSNAIVTGITYSGATFYDFSTVKISSSGQSLWTNRFSSPGNRQDLPFAVAVDGSDNVFVTGYATYSATDDDFLTIKYTSGGAPVWTNRYNGPAGGFDEAVAMAVDSSGNVIVTGTSYGVGGTRQWATLKYSNAGAQQWVRRYGDPGGSEAWAASVAVDSNNVYVTGYNTVGEYATIAYSSVGGTPLWTNNYGLGYFHSTPLEIATDNAGHVFVAGYAAKNFSPPYDLDYVTLAYSNSGAALWTNLYQGVNRNYDNDDLAVGMAVRAGKIFVTGNIPRGNNDNLEFSTVAYSLAGAQLWNQGYTGYDGLNAGHNFVMAITTDSSGNVFVTGQNNDPNNPGGATLAYSEGGILRWMNAIVSFNPAAIAADRGDNVFVTGLGPPGSGMTVKYNALPAPLLFQWINNKLVISWTDPKCALQSATSIPGTFTTIAGATSPYTNSPTGSMQFFRLKCN